MVRLAFLDEQTSGVVDSQSEFHTRKGFGKGMYLAVLAYEAGRLVGAVRAYWGSTPNHLEAGGTWVAPTYRRARLAQRLWARLLKETQPRSVFVKTISRNGARLVRALKERYPEIRWEWKKQ